MSGRAATSPPLTVEGPIHEWLERWRAAGRQALQSSPHPDAVRLALRQGFVLTHQQAYDEVGLSRAELRSLLRRRTWSAPRRGVLCVLPPDAARAGAMAVTAAALVRPGCCVVGGSAAVLHGLPLFAPPARPTLLAPEPGRAGGRKDVVVRTGQLPEGSSTTWLGVPLSTVARTVVDVARQNRRDGVIAGDAALAEGLIGVPDLDAAWEAVRTRPGALTARFVIGFVDARAESVLESMIRLLIHDHGVPLPTLQAWVDSPGGAYRVDGLWPERRVVLEVDGMVKYGDSRSLVREKRRQEHLEQAGYRVVRVTWQDVVGDPIGTVARIRWALQLGGHRPR